MFQDWKTQYCQFSLKMQSQYSPSQTPNRQFVDSDKLVLKFIWKCKGPRVAKTILMKSREDF